MTNYYKFEFFAANLAFAAVLLSGCNSGTSEVSFKSGGMTHTFAEGKSSIPKDFPLPLYPNATTTGSVSADGGAGGERSKFLMLASKDPVEQVSKYYLDELKASGWKVENQETSGGLINLSASQKDMEANVLVSGESGKTTISLSVSKTTGEMKAPADDSGNYEPNKVTPPTD